LNRSGIPKKYAPKNNANTNESEIILKNAKSIPWAFMPTSSLHIISINVKPERHENVSPIRMIAN